MENKELTRVSRTVTVELPSGLAGTLVAMLVQLASQYESQIYIETGSKKVNAKSIMGMMSLALNAGEQAVVIADGTDAESAVDHIEQYFQGK